MPEFILNRPPSVAEINMSRNTYPNRKRPHAFHNLSTFAQAYVEAAFFTNGDDDSERNENSLNELGAGRLTRDACKRIAKYCDLFETTFADLLEFAYENDANAPRQYDSESAGRDLWYTSKGHGVGFWDRDALRRDLPEDLLESFRAAHPDIFERADSTSIGDVLAACARDHGELYIESHRGWINAR